MPKQRTLHDVGSLENFTKALTAANKLWPGGEVTIDPRDPLVMVFFHRFQEVGKLDFSEDEPDLIRWEDDNPIQVDY